MMNDFLQQVKGGLIVSCQALKGEPLYSSYIMSKMAQAALEGGAVGIRANTVSDIKAIQKEVDLPIIGIFKQDYPNSEVFITPTLKEARAICELGVAVLALDATTRKRPQSETLKDIIQVVKREFPDVLIMGDTASLQDVAFAEQAGVDIIGTTLHGYTQETAGCNISHNEFAYLKSVLSHTQLPVIAEGKIDTPEKAEKVLELGARAVVVGGAITRPKEITERFIASIKQVKGEEV
ncbi:MULTISPECIES: N-acetylmannosamine-6-phosphate 2-epimerase [Listeria]|uniref:N-acetylmannosamine-6-phosphate 2-epimerase n=1 Tax=Listeria TaxID=1637 RepID=UPI000B590875|nr:MULTISPECIES: N-acetylmannosamine-6-phosphate 2-epimerase [Listeria]